MSNKNDDFNFEEFAVNAIRHIDSLRSYKSFGSRAETGTNASAKPRESRINAFYRAVGLPAAWPTKELVNETEGEQRKAFMTGLRPDPRNNGNIHELDFDSMVSDFDNRQLLFTLEPKDEEISNFLDLNKQDIRSGIVTDNTQTEQSRKRGLLFPMVVDGRIHVDGKGKRIAGAFMKDRERKDERFLYHRPLIETILHIKLKAGNVVDSSEQSDVTAAFQSVSLKELSRRGVRKINKTINSIAPVFISAMRTINRERRKTGVEIVPTIANVVQQKPTTRTNEKKKGSLDIKKEAQDYEKLIEDTIMALLKFSDKNSNLEGGALASALIEILTPKEKTTSAEKRKRTKQQLANAKSGIIQAYRSLELLFGTFAGISGVDIIVVIAALYRLENKYLIALLNKEAQARLELIKGKNVVSEANGIEVTVALGELEKEVTKIFDNIIASVKVTQHNQKPKNQIEEAEENTNSIV